MQVKELSIMFVPATNKSLENDEIRTLKQTSLKNGKKIPACFNAHLSVFTPSEGQVQKKKTLF